MLSEESQRTYALYIRDVFKAVGRRVRTYQEYIPLILFLAIFLSLSYNLTLGAPFGFPDDALVKIPQHSTVAEAAEKLQERDIVRSAFWLKALLHMTGRGVVAGEYSFSHPQNVFTIASRLANGSYELEPVRVTIPEGANVYEIAKLLSQSLADFDREKFLTLAEPKEGYLFPDTYFFYPGAEPELVLQTMENNFSLNIAKVATSTVVFDKPLRDIIIMASLLEEEAPKSEDRRIIAGILWRRIEIDMPLQVDAVFPYIIGKNSFTITKEELRTDSPYNTYVNKGLPIGPITNPGLDAIQAALTPLKSTYLYYLSDRQGNFHYCSTYICHMDNVRKYLR